MANVRLKDLGYVKLKALVDIMGSTYRRNYFVRDIWPCLIQKYAILDGLFPTEELCLKKACISSYLRSYHCTSLDKHSEDEIMALLRKTSRIWNGISGVTGIALLACTACCIPLFAPVLAWMGVAILGVLAPLSWTMLIAVIVLAGAMFLSRHRRNSCGDQGTSGCSTQCGTNNTSGGNGEAE